MIVQRLAQLPFKLNSRWLRLLVNTVGVTGIASAISLAATALLYRVLTPDEAGLLALLYTLVDTLMLIGGLGLSSLISRLYSRETLGTFDWRRDLSTITVITLPVFLIGGIVTAALYRFDTPSTLFILIATPTTALILCISQVLNSQRLYGWGNVLLRLPYSLMLIPALILPVISTTDRFGLTIWTQLVLYGLTIGYSIHAMRRRVGRGTRTIQARQLPQGLIFLASASSTVIADQVLIAAAGFVVTPAEIAALAALVLLFQPVQLLQNVFNKILITEFARQENAHIKRIVVFSSAACLIAVMLGALFIAPVAHFVYGGRYDWAFFLILPLALANALDLAEVIPRSYLVGRAATGLLNRFIFLQVIIALFGLAFGAAFILRDGIIGAAVGGVVIFVLRLAVSYGYFFKSLESK